MNESYSEFEDYDEYDTVLIKTNTTKCSSSNKNIQNNSKKDKRDGKKKQMNNCYSSKHIRKIENRK
jgi:hypothetical protein